MKKIAIVAHGLSGGGAERVASMLANHYSSVGHEVLYVAIYSEKKEYYLDEKIKYHFVDVKGKHGISAFLYRSYGIKKSVKDFKADVVISFITHELILMALGRTPLIPSLRNEPRSTESGFGRKAIRDIIYNNSKKIVFQTYGARDYFNSKIQNKGVIIRNPLKEGLPYWNEENHKKVFMTACRITAQKNLPMMIKAFSIFCKSHTEYRLEIYGDDRASCREELEKYVDRLGISDRVTFMGHSTEIHEKMCEAEAFILTSNYEGLSNSMLEAMAIGIPCICTDCPPGGAREMMEEREAGILVPIGDVDALVKAMISVADSKEYRMRLSENEKYIRNELRSDKIYSQWDTVIE